MREFHFRVKLQIVFSDDAKKIILVIKPTQTANAMYFVMKVRNADDRVINNPIVESYEIFGNTRGYDKEIYHLVSDVFLSVHKSDISFHTIQIDQYGIIPPQLIVSHSARAMVLQPSDGAASASTNSHSSTTAQPDTMLAISSPSLTATAIRPTVAIGPAISLSAATPTRIKFPIEPTKHYITPLRPVPRSLDCFQFYQTGLDASPYFQNWTFWKRVPLNIPSEAIPSLQAMFVYGRVYLYWVQTQQLDDSSLLTFTPGSNNQITNMSVKAKPNSKSFLQLMCSYQHLDGNWDPPQRMNEYNDLPGFFPGTSDDNPFVFNPKVVAPKIDIYGRYSTNGETDQNPYGLALLAGANLSFPRAFYDFLKRLYVSLATTLNFTQAPLPMFDVDQSSLINMPLDDLWGQYYWEIMHFAPLTLANSLQTAGQFETASVWYKGVFNPSLRSRRESRVGNQPISQFVFAPFTQALGNNVLTPLLTQRYLDDMHLHAFESHRMAALRGPLPYKKYILMKFIKNLIAWGDSLFIGDRESIGEAKLWYFAASDLLGDAPRGLYAARYNERLQNNTLDDLFIKEVTSAGTGNVYPTGGPMVIYPYNYTQSSYFHVPENHEFMALWSTVADRLYKIRHSLSITGAKQELALLSPPIDPHQLVAAVAARGGGFVRDILQALSGRNRPHYRFLVSLQKAKEFASYVENLGSQLLAVLEREDAAGLVKLNNDYAQEMLKKITCMKQLSKVQADKDFYQIGLTMDRAETERFILNENGDIEYKDSQFVKNNDEGGLQCVSGSLADSVKKRIDYYNGLLINNGMLNEEKEADTTRNEVTTKDKQIQTAEIVAHGLGAIPNMHVPWAVEWGSVQLSHIASIVGNVLTMDRHDKQRDSENASKSAGYKRRNEEWKLQKDLALKELEQLKIRQQLADIHKFIATQEYNNHIDSIKHQEAVNLYNSTQFTNVDLYLWLAEQLYDLYSTAYDLALRVANQAAASYQYELGTPAPLSTSGFWSNPRKGLLAGVKLTQQLHDMEQAYLDNHGRVPEVEKVFSLRAIKEAEGRNWPNMLNDLIQDGISFTLSAELFNRDFAIGADRVRKIKMVQVTTPALGGPNQQVNLKLSNQRSNEEVCISKSIAGTGMFNPSFDDARYLPFEGLNADDSSWSLVIGNNSATYREEMTRMYSTLSDIQIRVCYTIIPQLSSGSGLTL